MLLNRLNNEQEHVSEDENDVWICVVCGHVIMVKKHFVININI